MNASQKICNMNNPIDLLEQIKKVDAPPFLLTRIKQKIENAQYAHFSKGLSWSLVISLCMMVLLNIAVMIKYTNSTTSMQHSTIAAAMNLLPTNSLYE
jgi:hypothetical protein